ncbi:rhodanese-like domain-containing protein [Intestinibacter bartlettii]|uniref:Rhodanese-like domain-containing protein n=1 Tax=Intestinibacter bartlettii TaxID=261299 RepID=A0ABS6DVH3_9FIRM|nr:rhodanese-like domain-containing protein [Intestinibacter bartlettii]MBU5335816.1 rhodanese-like domain-containing protein [Intestinibacter bartlettii]
MAAVNSITANQTKRMLDSNRFSLIIDLRDYYEYSQGHLPNAINIPTNQIVDRINQIQGYTNGNVLLYCQHGIQSISVGKVLIVNGFRRVYSLDGGLDYYNYPLYY